MKQITIECILFIISGICIGQEVRIPVKSTGESVSTAMQQQLPSQRFLVSDTFEDKVEKGKLPPGWKLWIGYPPCVSTVPGKGGEGRGLFIDGSKGEICLSRSFQPQMGKFTVEMDISPVIFPHGKVAFFIGGEDFWVWKPEDFVCLKYDPQGDSAVKFSCIGDGMLRMEITPERSRWYHVRYIIDIPRHCFDLLIDGNTVISKSTFHNPASGLSCLVIHMVDKDKKGHDELLLDNLKIYPGTSVPSQGSPVAPGITPMLKGSTASTGNKVESIGKPGFRLTFHDEFDGDTLNTNYWNIGRKPTDTLSDKSLVKELYPYEIKDGILKLIVKKRGKTSREIEEYLSDYVAQMPSNMNDALKTYSAPAVATWNKFDQTYGWFEIRARMPKAFGIWECFWLYSYKPKTGGAEVDVVEDLTRLHDKVTCALHPHWDGGAKYGNPGISVPGKSDDFHVYAVNWEPEKLTYYVDGKPVGEFTGKGVPSTPEFIILSCRTGGGGGPYVDESALPDAFVIDYVRVYQKEKKQN